MDKSPPGPDAWIVYVSSSEGSDANDGLSEETPKATIAAGFALLRPGQGDHLLRKRGDTFRLASTLVWNKGGASAQEPMVFGAYGEGSRLVTSSLSHAVYVQSTSRDVTLRNNIFTRAFDGGMMRPGGVYEDNLVAEVTIGNHQGYMFSASAPIITEGVEARVTRNASSRWERTRPSRQGISERV